ncbi:NAD-P-binding protein [Mycena galopus ATCC 62051]|nr:NAD-P-binding protein [Mycena galopus ATCC 62051]
MGLFIQEEALERRVLSQLFPPKPIFSVDKIHDLSGQVIIVTGGNSGIGKETVKALLQHNAKVYLSAWSPERAREVIDNLKFQTGKEAEFLQMNLTDLYSRAAENFIQKESQLHVLFNDGTLSSTADIRTPIGQLTAQKYDLQFGTNVLTVGHFYLPKHLLPTLLATATSGKPACVVNIFSLSVEMFGENINYNALEESPARTRAGTLQMHHQNKFGNVVFSNELFRRSLNPGNLGTGLARHMDSKIQVLFLKLVSHLILYPVSHGALTQLWADITDVGATFGGKYFLAWARTTDLAEEMALWTWL